MLTITDNAGAVVTDLVSRNVSTDTGGLRIAEAPGDQFAVSIAEAPGSDDVVAQNGGARVYMEEPVATALDDKVLDARPGDNGAVQFVIALQQA